MTSEPSTPTADLTSVATLAVVQLVAFMPKVGPLHTLQHCDASSGFFTPAPACFRPGPSL